MKKLLFFDLECSNCFQGKGKVCEFGAVLTDEHFNIIREYDIPMNPGERREFRFDETIKIRDKGFDWAYDKDYYLTLREFPYYYRETIKKLLEDEDTIIFGYSIENDIRYLSYTLERYGFDQLAYRANDTRSIIIEMTESIKTGKLGEVFEKYCGKEAGINLTKHLSKDDAKMTMMITKKICENLDTDINGLLEKFADCHYDSLEYLKSRQTKKEKGSILHDAVVAWNSMSDQQAELVLKDESKGKVVTLSFKIKNDIDELSSIIEAIKTNNLIPSRHIDGSDTVVAFDEEDIEIIRSRLKRPYDGKIITYNDFIASLQNN